jgi:hypothetical protein
MSDSAVARGADVSWKSKLGYTYDGTVAAGPDDAGYYDLVAGDGATAHVHRDDITLRGEPEPAEDPELTPEQRAVLRSEGARVQANARVTDAILAVFTFLREAASRDTGSPPEDAALDDLRLEAVDLVAYEAAGLRDRMIDRIETKRQ